MTTITTPTIDLQDLIEQHAPTRLVRVSSSGQGEYAGPCPWCGGTDRFRVWPYSVRPHYWCRQCYQSGDAIQFMKDWLQLSFGEACYQLGLDPWLEGQERQQQFQQTADELPCLEWQSIGNALVQKAQQALWSPLGTDALAYLKSRGLTDETIRKAKLGYVPLNASGRWLEFPFESWGLKEEELTPAQLQKGCVRVPDGILIPWYESSTLWKLAVKRPGQKMDYGQILGSAEGLYNVDSVQSGVTCMMVEGEIDALSVYQEVNIGLGCVATGSATRGRLNRWVSLLCLASDVLQSFDADEGGDDGANWWLEKLPHARRYRPVGAKDPNELLQHSPEKLRNWLNASLEEDTQAEQESQQLQDAIIGKFMQYCEQEALNQPLQGQPICNTVVLYQFPMTEAMRRPHIAKKTRFRDVRGNNWCDECFWHSQLIDLGEKLGYPKLIGIEAGYDNYLHIARYGGIVQVEDAVRACRKLAGLSPTHEFVVHLLESDEAAPALAF